MNAKKFFWIALGLGVFAWLFLRRQINVTATVTVPEDEILITYK